MNATAQKTIWDFGPSKLAEELRKRGCRVTEAAVYAWLSGKATPRAPKARAIIEILKKVTISDLMAAHEEVDVGDRRQLPKTTKPSKTTNGKRKA